MALTFRQLITFSISFSYTGLDLDIVVLGRVKETSHYFHQSFYSMILKLPDGNENVNLILTSFYFIMEIKMIR